MISPFSEDTWKKTWRYADMVQLLADMKPGFICFQVVLWKAMILQPAINGKQSVLLKSVT